MAAIVERMNAESFREFRRAHPINKFDSERGIAWLPHPEGKACCVDCVSLWNNSAGGADEVLVVVGDSEPEAERELERVRPPRRKVDRR